MAAALATWATFITRGETAVFLRDVRNSSIKRQPAQQRRCSPLAAATRCLSARRCRSQPPADPADDRSFRTPASPASGSRVRQVQPAEAREEESHRDASRSAVGQVPCRVEVGRTEGDAVRASAVKKKTGAFKSAFPRANIQRLVCPIQPVGCLQLDVVLVGPGLHALLLELAVNEIPQMLVFLASCCPLRQVELAAEKELI